MKAYPEYRESGVEWLGQVPAHWLLGNLKHCVESARPITYGIVQAGEHIPDGVRYIRPADMHDEAGVLHEERLYRTSFSIAESYKRSMTKAGDLVCSIGPSFGKVLVLPPALDGANLTQGTARIAVSGKHSSKYIFWVLRSKPSYSQWESAVGGATFRALNLGPLAATIVLYPPIEEQRAIAAFLDRETAKIDGLIEEQRRLIDLLAEKRRAVIVHAVTKGLDRDAPMKPSGVEWLGDVPAHWRVVAIKRLSPVQRGASPRPIDDPKYFDDSGEFGWVRISDVTASRGQLHETEQTLSELGASLSVKIEPGSLFLSIAGSVGKPCIARIRACIHDGFVYFPRLQVDPYFLFRIFEARICFAGLGKMGTQLNLNTETVGAIRIALPPVSEIGKIIEFIDQSLRRIDGLINEAERMIALATERRAALITAAVTGKIDVRDAVPQTTEAA